MANGMPPIPMQRPSLEQLLQERAQQEAKTDQTRAQAELEKQRRLAAELEAQREQQEFEQSPGNRAYEMGKVAVPFGLGAYAGNRIGKGIEERQSRMKPSMRESMGFGRRVAPYLGKSMTYMVPEAAFLRYLASDMEEGEGKDAINAGSIGLAAAGLTNIGKGIVNATTSPDQEASPRSPMAQALAERQAGDQGRDITSSQTPTEGRTALPASEGMDDAPNAEEPRRERIQNSRRAAMAAKAAGVENADRNKKGVNIEETKKRLDDMTPSQRAEVARAVGESPSGPNLKTRIIRGLDRLSSPGASAIVAALLAADATRNRAQADDGEVDAGEAAQTAGTAAAAGGGTYAGIKGAEKLGEMAMRYAPGAMRLAGRAMPIVGGALLANDAYRAYQSADDIDPGPKYPTTRDIGRQYRQQQMQQASPMVRALMQRQGR